MFVRSISGLRFTEDEPIEKLVRQYAFAFHLYLESHNKLQPIAIGMDGRSTGEYIKNILLNTFKQIGRKCWILDIVPTPTVQIFVEKHHLAGGIIITASHNPAEWNGLKFINYNGIFLNAEENKQLWEKLQDNENNTYSEQSTINSKNDEPLYHTNVNEIKEQNNKFIGSDFAINEHIKYLLETTLIQKKIINIKKWAKKQNICFVIDAVNASGSKAIPVLFETLKLDYIKLFCNADGVFPHNPEPLQENIVEICDFIKNKNDNKNYIGIVVDPDADRLVLVNENGEYIGEEKTVCIAIDAILNNIENKTVVNVVTNQSTTALSEFVTDKYNMILHRSAVGEINVVNLMKETDAVIGGEGSGGVIWSECHYGRDSLVGIMLMLIKLSDIDLLLNEFISTYPQLFMLKEKITLHNRKNIIADFTNKLIENFPNANISLIDGIRVTGKNYWIHIRISNTEPIMRIIAEATELDEVKLLMDKIKQI